MIGKTIDNTNLSDFWQRSKDMVDNRIENSELSRFIDFNFAKVDGTAAITPLDKVADYVIARDEDRGYIKGTVGEYLFVSRDLVYTRSGNYDPVGDFTIEAGVYKIVKVVPSDETTISNGIDGCVAFAYAYDSDDYVGRVYTLEELQAVVNGKVDKVSGKSLSTNDYTNSDKNKLDEIETGAEVNVQSDWEQDDDAQDDFIKHKPSIPSKISDLENDSDFVHGISGSQMLRGTNSVTELTSSSFWRTSGWRRSAGSPVSISVTNLPVPDITLGWMLPSTGDSVGLEQWGIPMPNEDKVSLYDYTISCYAKGTGILSIEMGRLDSNGNDKWTVAEPKTLNNVTRWTRYEFLIEKENMNNAVTAMCKFMNTSAGTIDICGMKLELGTQATQWSLSPYETDNSNVDLSGIESDIDTLDTNQTQILSDIEDLEHSLSLTSTATGNPISISDSAHVNAEELTVTLEPIQSGSGDPSPTNIRPISGYDETSVVIKDTAENPTVTDTYTLQFGDTVYGAEVDFVSGVATVTKGYIAEYAGETLPSTWISDRDVYASGTTPTTGAQVVYELATPYTIQLTPQQIKMLKGNNVLVADGDMNLTYQADGVVGDIKEWAEEHFIPYNSYNTPPVFGFHIDGNNSDPSSRVTYIGDNANFTPAHMDYTTDKFRYNSWRDIWFVKYCRPCILDQDGTVKAYLNPNDYTKDVDGNTVVIDENLTDANVMIEFPKIWYKVVPDAGDTTSASVYFSPVKVDEDYKDYAYIDKDGVHKEHFYMPAYNGSVLDGTTVMRSLSGQAVSKNLDASTEIAYAKANGDGWNTEDAGEVMLINFLLILMGKSTDTQTVFGRGIDTGGETAFNNYVTGAGNMKGLFYGTNTGTGLVKVFGIENWWGLQWRRYAGDVLDNGVRKVKLCYGNEDGSTTFDFNIDGTGYVDVGVTPSGTNGGYIRTMKFTHDGMYSAISDGSSSTYFCDAQWFNNAYHTIYALRGGNAWNGVLCGAFYVYLSTAPGYRGVHIGAAVSYK